MPLFPIAPRRILDRSARAQEAASCRRGLTAALLAASLFMAACDAGSGGTGVHGSGGAGGDASTTTAVTSSGSGTTSGTSTSTSAGTGGGASCASLPLCDDFEGAAAGGAPDPARWSVLSPNCSGSGAVTVDDTQAHSGTKSVKVSGKGGYCNHVFFANQAAIAAVGAVVWARFFVRFSDALGDGHTTFLAMKDVNDGGKDLRMGGQSKILMFNRESDDATLPALSPAGIAQSVAPAAQQWICVELMADGAAGHLEAYVDGSKVPGLVVDGTPTPDIDQQWLSKASWKPGLADFKLGWESYAGQDMTLWFDDVAIAAQRVGCQ